MFIGREKELKHLNKLYSDTAFQFVVMFGRKRIGKTELLKEFSKNKNAIFYSALEKKSNLDEFSSEVFKHFNENNNLLFKTWKDAFQSYKKKTSFNY